ncbi:MAG: DUF4328 domain-containing protein [Planctomycetota bacterium]
MSQPPDERNEDAVLEAEVVEPDRPSIGELSRQLGYAGVNTLPIADNSGRASAARGLMLAHVIFDLVFIAGSVLLLVALLAGFDVEEMFTDGGQPISGMIAIGFAFMCIGLAYLLVVVLAYVFYFMWQYRAAWNMRIAGRMTHFTPGWGVGWWFIPFANLVMVGRVLQDLWQAAGRGTAEAVDGLPTRVHLFFWLSFAIFLASFLMGFASPQDPNRPFEITPVDHMVTLLDIVSSGLWIVFLLLLRKFIAAIQTEQPMHGPRLQL